MDRFIKSPLSINTSKGLTTWPLRLSWNHTAFVWFLILRVGYYTVLDCDVNKNVVYLVLSIAPICRDDMYGGFRVKLNTICETIITPLSVDISIGNVVVAPLAL